MGGDANFKDTEDQEPPSTNSNSAGNLGEDESARKALLRSSDVHRSVRQSSSDTNLRARPETTAVASIVVSNPGAGLRPPRPRGQRSSSNSQIEKSSFMRSTISPETISQRQIMARLSNVQRSDALKCSKSQSRSRTGTSTAKDDQPTNALELGSAIRSVSDLDLQLPLETLSIPELGKPLQTCSKQKAKSANVTPLIEAATSARSSVESQKLRRVKTVDFEKAIFKSLSPQQEAPVSTSQRRQPRGRKVPANLNSCPGAALLARRSPAGSAVTRTDVHVIAIVPSSSRFTGMDAAVRGDLQEADPATPTMQVVESGNGSYEVVWDDVPTEHSARTQRRSSSASQALEAASAGTKGLERVNTKLTEWSGTWNTLSDSFKPAIVVFPDDDGRRPHFECAIVVNEDINIMVPPNSKRVSAAHSRRSSRPASAQMSRASSHDEHSELMVPRDIPIDNPTTSLEAALVVPDSEAWSAQLVAARRKLGVPSPERKLSNVEEADLKFRNHRDSLTLAHGRLVDSSGVRPELLAHRDSVKIANKRMHARNHKHAHRLESRSDPGNMPTVKPPRYRRCP